MHKKLALTPPMGWNSWDCYGAAVNEEQLIANADYMAEHLKDYGWEYVVCDIQWSEPTATVFITITLLRFVWTNIHALFRRLNVFPHLQAVKASSRLPIISTPSVLNSVYIL